MISLKVNEIFYSIQGEGCWSGCPAAFIRLCGCNLKCDWCDTSHSTCFFEGSAKEIVQEILHLLPFEENKPMLVITGGEPTVWAYRLIDLAIEAGKFFPKISIETNGTLPHCLVSLKKEIPSCWVTWSPKPSFFEYTEVHFQEMAKVANELKIVYEPSVDFDFWNNYARENGFFDRHSAFIQPCSQEYEPAIKFVKMHPMWRLSIQTQKIMNIK